MEAIDESVGFRCGGRADMHGLDIMAQPLLAAGHQQEIAVKRAVPLPIQSCFAEGGVEGMAMRLLGVRERAVDIEDEAAQRHHPPLMSAARAAGRARWVTHHPAIEVREHLAGPRIQR
jgi:hypothetical protein